MFEVGKTYSNREDILKGFSAFFVVVGRTEKTLSIQVGTTGKPYNVRIRKTTQGGEWVKISPSPYASAIHA